MNKEHLKDKTVKFEIYSQYTIRLNTPYGFYLAFYEFFLCMFLLSVYICKNFYTFFVHAYIFILLLYHSLDNDRSKVETLCFTVGFYR